MAVGMQEPIYHACCFQHWLSLCRSAIKLWLTKQLCDRCCKQCFLSQPWSHAAHTSVSQQWFSHTDALFIIMRWSSVFFRSCCFKSLYKIITECSDSCCILYLGLKLYTWLRYVAPAVSSNTQTHYMKNKKLRRLWCTPR